MSDSPPDGLAHWQATTAQQLLGYYKRQTRLYDRLNGIDPDNRPTIHVEHPRDPDWLAARSAFAARWQALVEEGFTNQWLERAEDGFEITDAFTELIEEPNPAYDPSKPNPYTVQPGATITIPIVQEPR